jgi:hypothetical protein
MATPIADDFAAIAARLREIEELEDLKAFAARMREARDAVPEPERLSALCAFLRQEIEMQRADEPAE